MEILATLGELLGVSIVPLLEFLFIFPKRFICKHDRELRVI